MFAMKSREDAAKSSNLNVSYSYYTNNFTSSAIKQNLQNNTSNENGRKPYMMLDDKLFSKTPKNSNSQNTILSRQPKSTTNAESQIFSFNSASTANSNNSFKQNKQSNLQEQITKKPALKASQTPSNKILSNLNQREETSPSPILSTPSQIYYMTWLEKYHRHPDERDYFSQIYREHFMQSFQAMGFCKFIKPVDPKVLAQKKVFLTKRETHKGAFYNLFGLISS